MVHNQAHDEADNMMWLVGKRNGYWKTHSRPELQTLLLLFDAQGWRIKDPPTYYKALCSCEGQHWTTIHLTPSNPKYALNKRKWLERQPCYRKEER